MAWSLLWSKPALYIYGAILLTLAYAGWHHHVYQQGYDMRASEDALAIVELQKKATKAANVAVTGVVNEQAKNRPAVTRVVTRILRECSAVQPAAPAGVSDAPARSTQDFAADLGSDIQSCADDLERFKGLIKWVDEVSSP